MIESLTEQAPAEDLRRTRRQGAPERALGSSDSLPPNDGSAEQGVIACVLLSPELFVQCQEKFGSEEVFFDLRHAAIWHALAFLHAQKKGIDVITLQEELKGRQLLEQVGGIDYLARLPDTVSSTENLEYYISIVWEKFIARRLVANTTERAGKIISTNGQMPESLVAAIDQDHREWKQLLERGAPSPKNLCAPHDFAEAYFNAWFDRRSDVYGYELPFQFPLRWRPSEMTLFTGDNGSGKSSMLGLISIVCAKQFAAAEKVVIASMEVPPEITLWIMARQLIGKGHLERSDANERRVRAALDWLNERMLIYNFLGITDWRELLNTFRFAREHRKGAVFIVDSVMRIGIPDDDYALQGIAAAAFADFAVKQGGHVFLVVHENKGDGRAKDKVRGSKQWTDNAHNVCGMKRNEAKAEKLEELKAELKAGTIKMEAFNERKEGMRKTWDSKFILSKQRWPGSQQNASRWLYFDHESLQFHEQPGLGAIDYTLK